MVMMLFSTIKPVTYRVLLMRYATNTHNEKIDCQQLWKIGIWFKDVSVYVEIGREIFGSLNQFFQVETLSFHDFRTDLFLSFSPFFFLLFPVEQFAPEGIDIYWVSTIKPSMLTKFPLFLLLLFKASVAYVYINIIDASLFSLSGMNSVYLYMYTWRCTSLCQVY